MHIADGILPAPAAIAGYAAALAASAVSLYRIKREEIPKTALLTAAFFLSSLIHVPIPPTSVHFMLNGLTGILLGRKAFIAVLIGLLFQAALFGHGGLTTLGINAVIIGLPAYCAYFIYKLQKIIPLENKIIQFIFAFTASACALMITICAAFLIIFLTVPEDLNQTFGKIGFAALTVGYIPLVIIEGIFTAFVVLFLQRIKPELLA